ncbi:hypothetical protein KUTeg_018318 [Tegillarca granosa]|uniref:Uncharacterized protein n=1 Tax=Tegillarca granosa TaxID=220873 RepID=A0ABQ9EMH4_TEGGR|nr:hypothetical protein KUTeg_018318 [Tegillarca granosa]
MIYEEQNHFGNEPHLPIFFLKIESSINTPFPWKFQQMKLIPTKLQKEKVNTLSKQTQTLTIEDFRQEVTITPADTDIQDSGILQVNTFRLQQNEQEPECQYCLCKPCITNENNKQLWWEDEPLPPRDNNNKDRKERYKYFWTMLLHRGVWDDERYKERKSLAINKDPQRKQFVWHKRDIMPLCVLKLERK